MLGRSFLIWMFAASAAMAQSYPSPTYNNITVNGNYYTPSKTGYFYGNGAGAATFSTTIPGTSVPFTQSGSGAVTSNVNTKLLSLSLSPLDYGAVGDAKGNVDGAITVSSTAFTSASTTFSVSDVGKIIRIVGAGTSGATFETTISAYVSAHAVTLAAAANTTVSGATFYYGTDNATAWQNAVNQCQSTYGKIDSGPGIFIISSALSITGSCDISGDGGNSTVIQPSVAANGLTVNTNAPVIFEKFGIIYVGAANTGTSGISLGGTSSYGNSQSVMRDIVVSNAQDCVLTTSAYSWVIDNMKCLNYGNVGAVIQETYIGDAGDSKLINSYFSSRNASSLACFQWLSSGGFHLVNNTCVSDPTKPASYGLLAQLTNGVNTGQLFVSLNTFDGSCAVACISFSRLGSTGTYGRVIIANNGFNLAKFGVSVNTDANGAWIESMQILGNYWYDNGTASNYAFYIDSVRELIISYNSGIATVTTDTLIATLSGVTNAIIGPNMKGNRGTGTQTWAANSLSGTNVTTIAPN